MPTRILLVCTGNTCRSTMAEALFRKHLAQRLGAGADQVEVLSAGTDAVEGDLASPQAIEVMRERALDLTHHRSHPVTESLLSQADLVLTMTGRHRDRLVEMLPEAREKIHTLRAYLKELGGAPPGDSEDISDPFGGDTELYRQTADQLDRLIRELVDRLFPAGEAQEGEKR
ncbi:MAG: low molecular weight protein arginine phosphatase [Bacillota bacterium]